MNDLSISYLPYAIAIYVLLRIVSFIARKLTPLKKTPFGFKGKLIYADKGKSSATFLNKKYAIAAKGGDFIYLTENGNYRLIEYKSRNGPVYPSDIAQTVASVLAARSRFPIVEAYVFTESTSKEINVSGSDEQLYNQIKDAHLLTQQIKNGLKVYTCYSNQYKCRSCSMSRYCDFKYGIQH